LITVQHNSETYEFNTLDQAMAWAKELGEFVTIQFNGMEVSGKFGADGIIDGMEKTPKTIVSVLKIFLLVIEFL